ncbi:MAG: hypothetical protein WCW84_11335 [Sulfurimonas sp.]|jgi:hypothetical protein
MEKTYTILDILSEENILEMISLAAKDGSELAAAEGIEFDISYNTCNGNTETVNSYKKRLANNSLNQSDESIIQKYKAM